MLGLSVLLLSSGTFAAKLTVELSEPEVEMGKYLSARIIYSGEITPARADLQQWQDDFFIERRDTDSENLVSGQILTTEHLRLYPRATGDKVLEPIALAGAIAHPVSVSATAAVRDGIDGTPHWLPLPARMWQGQAIEVGIELALLHPSNQIAVAEAAFPGFTVEALPRAKLSGKGAARVQLRWRLTAQRMGIHHLDPPTIEQRGRGRWRFYLRPAEIDVLPLPSYLPPTVPVGRLSAQSAVHSLDSRPVWELTLSNRGQLPEEIHGVRAQLARIAGADIEAIGVSAVTASDEQPDVFRQTYRIPVPAWSWGLGAGPDVALHYFDTQQGRLRTITQRLPAVWRMPTKAFYLLVLVLGVICSMLLFGTIKMLQRMRMRRDYRHSLARASDPHELRRLLLAPGGHKSLEAWAAARGGVAQGVMVELNALCFGRAAAASQTEIKRQLRSVRLD